MAIAFPKYKDEIKVKENRCSKRLFRQGKKVAAQVTKAHVITLQTLF